MSTDPRRDGSDVNQDGDQKANLVSVEAALSRANTLTLAALLQDTILRIGTVLVLVVSRGDPSWHRAVAALLILGSAWMLSKHTLNGIIARIEQDFVSRALRHDTGEQSTKWEHLSIMLGTHESATRSRLLTGRILALEPLLLTGVLAALAVVL